MMLPTGAGMTPARKPRNQPQPPAF